jgi:large subunit ribosomal protein L21
MYAVIETGGKQYKVAKGDVLNIELTEIAADATTIDLDKVLLVGEGKDVMVGKPYVAGAKVVAKFAKTAGEGVVGGEKVYPTYFRRRKSSKKRTGHRQKFLQVTVDEIVHTRGRG